MLVRQGRWCAGLLLVAGLLLGGCTADGFTAMAAGGTVIGAQAPTNEIEQVYYLGCFDPQNQLPPTIYRVTVRGQASFISFTRFASGWAPASFIDSLSTRVSFEDKDKNLTYSQDSADHAGTLKTGRRLMLFGPEGFREAPADQRLVIVMGTNPEGFFQAIDDASAKVVQAEAVDNPAVTAEMSAELERIKGEQAALAKTSDNLKGTTGGGK